MSSSSCAIHCVELEATKSVVDSKVQGISIVDLLHGRDYNCKFQVSKIPSMISIGINKSLSLHRLSMRRVHVDYYVMLSLVKFCSYHIEVRAELLAIVLKCAKSSFSDLEFLSMMYVFEKKQEAQWRSTMRNDELAQIACTKDFGKSNGE